MEVAKKKKEERESEDPLLPSLASEMERVF